MKKVKFTTITTKTPRSWSEWISPRMSKYFLKCCDCGLVHEFQFRVFVESKYKGKKWATVIDDKQFKVDFRVKRLTPTSKN